MSTITHIAEMIKELEPIRMSLLGVSYQLVTVCFAISVIFYQYTVLEGQGDIKAIIGKVIFFFGMLAVYNSFFINTEKVALGIASEIFSGKSFRDFMDTISIGMEKNTQVYKNNVLGILQSGISGLIVTVTYIVSVLSYEIIIILKVLILGIFYITGPLVFALSILPNSGDIAVSWFKNVLAISSWPIVMNILFLLQKLLGVAVFHSNINDYIPIVAANITFALAVVSTPIISSMLINGLSSASLGSSLATNMFNATAATAVASKMKGAAVGVAANGFSNMTRRMTSTSSSTSTPQTTSSRKGSSGTSPPNTKDVLNFNKS